jgi:hypothetical protein
MANESLGADAYLAINEATYIRLVLKVQGGFTANDVGKSLADISAAAGFAAAFHTGRFIDGRIENLLVKMGERLPTQTIGPQLQASSRPVESLPRRRVLHVATHVTEIAGHTRMLHHWAMHDLDSAHALVITAQGKR